MAATVKGNGIRFRPYFILDYFCQLENPANTVRHTKNAGWFDGNAGYSWMAVRAKIIVLQRRKTMKLPNEFKLSNTHHRHGGRITRITEIKHEIAKPKGGRSQDIWFFIGDVGGLLRAMNTYLAAQGEWYDRDSGHDGWYANKRK